MLWLHDVACLHVYTTVDILAFFTKLIGIVGEGKVGLIPGWGKIMLRKVCLGSIKQSKVWLGELLGHCLMQCSVSIKFLDPWGIAVWHGLLMYHLLSRSLVFGVTVGGWVGQVSSVGHRLSPEHHRFLRTTHQIPGNLYRWDAPMQVTGNNTGERYMYPLWW